MSDENVIPFRPKTKNPPMPMEMKFAGQGSFQWVQVHAQDEQGNVALFEVVAFIPGFPVPIQAMDTPIVGLFQPLS